MRQTDRNHANGNVHKFVTDYLQPVIGSRCCLMGCSEVLIFTRDVVVTVVSKSGSHLRHHATYAP
jgi:hypothetical protein